MAGPIEGGSQTRIIGNGFKPSKSNIRVKWGTITSDSVSKALVEDYIYEQALFENIIEGSEELKAYIYEASSFPRVDSVMVEEGVYNSVFMTSPQPFNAANSYGGPYYLETGLHKNV